LIAIVGDKLSVANRCTPQLFQSHGFLLTVHGGLENVEEINRYVVRSGLCDGAYHAAESKR
jgi:hypothetical protein